MRRKKNAFGGGGFGIASDGHVYSTTGDFCDILLESY